MTRGMIRVKARLGPLWDIPLKSWGKWLAKDNDNVP